MTAAEIRKFHTSPPPAGNGWSDIGYHFVIRTDGATEVGRPLTRAGAGVKGHNKDNIHICLVGGLDGKGQPTDNYTESQYHALAALVIELCEKHSIDHANVVGHRDWFGLKEQWAKVCPCFDVRSWMRLVVASMMFGGEDGRS
ncbi:N-acetylmuramoyl-L-alanine amidase [Vibrio phage 2.117.O._10N.261.45.E9]|nr:N-acetylmuramoyl-L-alanine amidase [Vibrio phage 1.117.O._10N.261.45.E9]AUR95425.1 N-acetylmuramoyl-L-alanine amidase [Vibrio phage 1.207.B._10N.222.51.C2]AUS02316.1 N-acetylmuramoyl-L-alanine amidase [Vibrio phage 2.117.O._10N.261.45.E9]